MDTMWRSKLKLSFFINECCSDKLPSLQLLVITNFNILNQAKKNRSLANQNFLSIEFSYQDIDSNWMLIWKKCCFLMTNWTDTTVIIILLCEHKIIDWSIHVFHIDFVLMVSTNHSNLIFHIIVFSLSIIHIYWTWLTAT